MLFAALDALWRHAEVAEDRHDRQAASLWHDAYEACRRYRKEWVEAAALDHMNLFAAQQRRLALIAQAMTTAHLARLTRPLKRLRSAV